MIRWVVGSQPSGGVFAAKFPQDDTSSGIHSLEKVVQPASLCKEVSTNEIELEVGADNPRFRQFQKKSAPLPPKRVKEEQNWTVRDRDNRVKFRGQPSGIESNCWFVVKEQLGEDGEKEYAVLKVDQWLSFTASTAAQESAVSLEESERRMKESGQKAKSEFAEYLRQKRKKAEENGFVIPADVLHAESEANEVKQKSKQRKLVLKRLRRADDGEGAETSVGYIGGDKDNDGEWEGEEAFSDDDDKLFDDEANANMELGMDVEDDDVEKDKTLLDENEAEVLAEELFKDTFGSEIEKIMHNEQEKEHVADDELDNELLEYAGDEEGADEEGEAGAGSVSAEGKPAAAKAKDVPVPKKASKEEQIRARVKGMFWRNEHKLKLKDVLSQFPGLSRTSEDYQFLTRALKDLATVKDGMLHLRPEFKR